MTSLEWLVCLVRLCWLSKHPLLRVYWSWCLRLHLSLSFRNDSIFEWFGSLGALDFFFIFSRPHIRIPRDFLMKNDYPWSLFGMAHFLTDSAPWWLPTLTESLKKKKSGGRQRQRYLTQRISCLSLNTECLSSLGGPVYLIPGRIIHYHLTQGREQSKI